MADTIHVSLTTVPLSAAQAAISAGISHGRDLGLPFTLTVLDASGLSVALARMDGAAMASIETSESKARTAFMFAASTLDLAAAVQPGAPLYTIDTATRSPLAFVPGGVPLVDEEGRVIGAVGAGGGTPDQDHEVATAAVAAFRASGRS